MIGARSLGMTIEEDSPDGSVKSQCSLVEEKKSRQPI
jgi:hypothetical protein